ncbi:MAG: hypothetical protein C0627_03445 [Sulfurimonas sp.]|nr:MAG: hypothetical protein C0627_03445 [Sulfurimonas sp.]
MLFMLEEIKNRNHKIIEQQIEELGISLSVDDIVNLASIFISVEEKANRIRLVGNKKDTEKTKKIQIKKFSMKYCSVDGNYDDLIYSLNFFIKVIEEIKMIKNIESIEADYKGMLKKYSHKIEL